MIPANPDQRSASGRLEIQNQVLVYSLPLLPTPYTLCYRSDRVRGREGSRAIVIPLAPRKPSRRLKQVAVEISVGGETTARTFDPSVRTYRHVIDSVPPTAGPDPAVRIRVGQVLRPSFPIPAMTKWREHTLPLHPPDARALGLGGWTLDAHHRFDPLTRVVHFGSGTRRRFAPQEITRKKGEISVDGDRDGLVFVFDEQGRHLRSLDALTGAIEMEFSYGPSGELVALIDGFENETRIERRPEQSAIAIRTAAGDSGEIRIDESGYVSEIRAPSGRTTTLVHSDGGLLQSVVLPEGLRAAFRYDEHGALIAVHEGERKFELVAQDDGTRRTVALIDGAGREIVIDREVADSGEIRRTSRCCGGNEIRSVSRPDGTEEISYPDGTRLVVEETAAQSNATTILPSGMISKLRSTRRHQGKTTVETLDINGRRFETVRDRARRIVTSATPEGRQTVAEFDASGRMSRFSLWSGARVERRWDRRGNLVEVAEQNGDERRAWKLSRDASGCLSEARDPAGQVTKFQFDSDGRLTRLIASEGEVNYAYRNGLAEIVTRTGARVPLFAPTVLARSGVQTRFVRPGVVGEIRAGTSWRSFEYAAGTGLVTGARSSDGVDVNLDRDATLITGVTYSGVFTAKVKREFDRDEQLVSESVNDARVEYGYDRDGLMVQAGKLAIERDGKTGLIARKRIGSVDIHHAWTGFGELRELRCTIGDVELFALSQRHDSMGRIVEKVERIAGTVRQRSYTYDTAGRLAAIAAGGTTVSRFTYDANGNRIRAELEGKTIDARYDPNDRILETAGWRFGHTEHGDVAFAENAGRTTRYEYDPLGPLRSVTVGGGRTVSWAFDAFGRPCQKRVDGAVSTTWVFDHSHRVVAEMDDGRIRSRFIWGTLSNVPEYLERDGRTLLLVCDAIGTPRLIVDAHDGTIAQRIEIDDLGATAADGEPVQPFGFAGGIHDPVSGLTRFGARHYDAMTGRWTQPDPIGYAAGTNLYEYAESDPINRIDPLGLTPDGEVYGPPVATQGTGDGITFTIYGDAPGNRLIPPQTGRGNLNPQPPAFNWRDLFNPKDPGPFPAGLPGLPPQRGQFDFRFRGWQCFVSGQNRTPYDQSDSGGLPRDSYTGQTAPNDYRVTPGTTGGRFGFRF